MFLFYVTQRLGIGNGCAHDSRPISSWAVHVNTSWNSNEFSAKPGWTWVREDWGVFVWLGACHKHTHVHNRRKRRIMSNQCMCECVCLRTRAKERHKNRERVREGERKRERKRKRESVAGRLLLSCPSNSNFNFKHVRDCKQTRKKLFIYVVAFCLFIIVQIKCLALVQWLANYSCKPPNIPVVSSFLTD